MNFDLSTVLIFHKRSILFSRENAYHEHVLHFDGATMQNGGYNRGDLDGTAVPHLPAARFNHVTLQRRHHNSLLLQQASLAHIGLHLGDVDRWHHGPSGGVDELGEHRNDLACRHNEGGRIET